MNKLLLLLVVFWAAFSYANEDVDAHSHYMRWDISLNKEYPVLVLEIKLDEKNDNAKELKATFGEHVVTANEQQLSKLRNLELETIKIVYSNYCETEPFEGAVDELIDGEHTCIFIRVRQGWRNPEFHLHEANYKYAGPNTMAITISTVSRKIWLEEYSFPW